MAEPQRVHVSSFTDLASRYRAFLVPGAVEVEERASYEVASRRILFDEVEVLTLHKTKPWALTIALLAVAGLALLVAQLLNSGGETETALGFALVALAIAVPGLASFLLPVHVITIHGRRARVRVVFRFRPAKAREWFARLSREIERAQAQQRAAAERPPS